MICTHNGIASVGDYENIAFVSGTTPYHSKIDDTDPSHYRVSSPPLTHPAIDIEKSTNGVDADNAVDAVILNIGDTVIWQYIVRNIGNVILTDVNVTDDKEGEVICPKTTLAISEVMVCELNSTAVIGDYENIATAVAVPLTGGTVNDTDPSHYKVISVVNAPAIDVEKSTNGIDADFTTNAIELIRGDDIRWTYVVRNIGNVELNVTLRDDMEGSVPCPKSRLSVGESMICELTGVASEITYKNIVKAIGVPPVGTDVNDTDPSHYKIILASIGNFFWIDENENGKVDNNEKGYNGVTVTLYSDNGTIIDTQITRNGPDGEAGYYLFEKLTPNQTYQVHFDFSNVPELNGYVYSPLVSGDNANKADEQGFSIYLTPTVGDLILIIDAGIHKDNSSPVCIPVCTPTCPPTPISVPPTIVLQSGTTSFSFPNGLNLISFGQPKYGSVMVDNAGTINDISDDNLIYTANAGYSGIDSFTYMIRDINGNEVEKIATVLVPSMIQSRGETFGVLGSGESLVSFTQANHGEVILDDGGTANSTADDTLRYIPNDGYAGVDTFSYTIMDSHGDIIIKKVTFTVESTESDSADTLHYMGMLMMLILTIGFYYIRQEELNAEE